MIHDMMPGTEEQLAKEMTSAYIGFDPTGDSLHMGSLVPIMILKQLQLANLGGRPLDCLHIALGSTTRDAARALGIECRIPARPEMEALAEELCTI